MAPQLMQQFAAYVGIDWADRKHDFCLQTGGGDTVEFGCLPHRVECIDEWARALHQRFGGPIAVALELAKGPIVSALQKYGFFTLFPINPSTLAKYRLALSRVVPRTIPQTRSWRWTCCCVTPSGLRRSNRRASVCDR
jgi:hypothetical protein